MLWRAIWNCWSVVRNSLRESPESSDGEFRILVTALVYLEYSPVPELSFLPAPCRGWTRAGEKRLQDNLHAQAQNEPIKNHLAVVDKSPYLLLPTCRAIPFLAHALKKKFLWCWYCGKKRIDMCFIVVYTLIDNDYASLLFSQTFFRISAFWASLQRVLKGKSDAYKKLICIMQRVHFQVWVDVFSCQQILTEISFVVFDIVVKNKSNVV